uniref:Nucleotide pyrophosphatase n=1 Tax=Schlesneria paludicola TaxID=360056 RepID=A0A7C4LLH9_9PLAN
MVRHALLQLGLLLACCWSAAADEPARKVLFIGIDGCRWDAVQAARTPHLDRLVEDGFLALGTDIIAPRETPGDTVSGPGWSNLLCGVWPDKHGVIDNSFKGANYQRYPHVFARIKEVNPRAVTASFSDWAPIHTKILSAADEVFTEDARGAAEYAAADARAVDACCTLLQRKHPDVVMLYQGQVDETGHAHGFHPTVAEYRQAIERVDAHIGRVLETIRMRPTFAAEDWLVLVATDHGGVGLNHGGGRQMEEIRKTFLIVSGPSALRGRTEAPTYQVDVVATALAHLRIVPRPEWELDGRPVGLKSLPMR